MHIRTQSQQKNTQTEREQTMQNELRAYILISLFQFLGFSGHFKTFQSN